MIIFTYNLKTKIRIMGEKTEIHILEEIIISLSKRLNDYEIRLKISVDDYNRVARELNEFKNKSTKP